LLGKADIMGRVALKPNLILFRGLMGAKGLKGRRGPQGSKGGPVPEAMLAIIFGQKGKILGFCG
jgi:hypothetical protein